MAKGDSMMLGHRFTNLVAAALAIALSPATFADGVLYVDDDAPLGGDGLGWATACTFLQDALASAVPGTEIRVAGGTYRPDADEAGNVTPGDREASFQLVNGVAIRGGYAGYGAAAPDLRIPALYETVLSGDLLGNDGFDFVNNDENSRHIIRAGGTDQTAVLETVTVTAGNADGAADQGRGAGLYIDTFGCPTVTDCRFTWNWGADAGAAIFASVLSAPTITGCFFAGNHCEGQGGAIHVDVFSDPMVTDCTFLENSAFQGAALSCDSSDPVLDHCTFDSNTDGGAIFIVNNSNPVLNECTFVGNDTDGGGGGVKCEGSTLLVTACTFADNGGLFGSNGAGLQLSTSTTTVLGCTFTGNSGGLGGAVSSPSGDTAIINCLFTRNRAWSDGNGGGAINVSGNGTIVNCAFYANECGLGGAVKTHGAGDLIVANCLFSGNIGDHGAAMAAGGSPTVVNCIVAGNTPDQIYEASQVSYSLVEGGYPGEGNIDGVPLLVRVPDPGPDGEWATDDDDYGDLHLQPGSPGIDAGNNDAVPPDRADLDNDGDVDEPTPLDFGRSDRFLDDPAVVDTGNGVPPIVDIGAYENHADLCPADLDDDGTVGVTDFLLLLAVWGTDPGGPPDFNGDYDVGIADFLILLARWGPCP
jgi:parallel beta-helix repeat protein/predicted outer membrane repeat protein